GEWFLDVLRQRHGPPGGQQRQRRCPRRQRLDLFRRQPPDRDLRWRGMERWRGLRRILHGPRQRLRFGRRQRHLHRPARKFWHAREERRRQLHLQRQGRPVVGLL